MSSADLGSTSAGGWLYPPGGWLSPDGWLYPLAWVVIPPRVGCYTPTFTLDADFHGDHESGPRCGCSQPTFPSIRHVQAIAHGCACSHCKRGLKMEVRGCDIFLFWRCKRSRDLWLHAQGPPSCSHSNGKAWMSRPRAGFRPPTLKTAILIITS